MKKIFMFLSGLVIFCVIISIFSVNTAFCAEDDKFKLPPQPKIQKRQIELPKQESSVPQKNFLVFADLEIGNFIINALDTTSIEINMQVTIRNTGTGPAPQSRLRMTLDNPNLSTITMVPAINATSQQNVTIRLPLNGQRLPAGRHTITLTIDDNNAIAELNDNNNTKTVDVNVEEPKPDLWIDWVTVNSLNTSSAEINATLLIRNTGTGPAPQSRLRMTVDNNPNLSTTTMVPAIASQNMRRVDNIRLPLNGQQLPAGRHTITFTIDDDNAIVELNENNNIKTVDVNVEVGMPDLTITNVQLRNGPINFNMREIYFDVKVKNIGTADCNVNALELDWQIVDPPACSQNFMSGSGRVIIKPGEEKIFSVGWESVIHTLRINFHCGARYALKFTVDLNNRIPELNENNNSFSPFQLDIAEAPVADLIVNRITVTNAPITVISNTIECEVNVKNIGTNMARPSVLLFYLGQNGRVVKAENFPVDAVGIGDNKTVRVVLPLDHIPAGQYDLCAEADFHLNIDELNENNNVLKIPLEILPAQ